MKLAVFTPLPPVRSGIAHYASMLLPALARRHQVAAVVDQEIHEAPRDCRVVQTREFDASQFDAAIYQLGNNPYHQFAYEAAMKRAGIVVLHDFVLHHLIVEATLARGHADAYIAEMRLNHGSAGVALARGRKAGFHGEIGNFLYPASALVAAQSKAVIVHNRYAAEFLRKQGVETPIVVVGHPYLATARKSSRDEIRARLNYSSDDLVIGLFGFLTEAKRPAIVLEAFARALREEPRLRLLIVGEPAPNIDLDSLMRTLPRESWKALGFVADHEFDAYLAAVDKVVNLRYPSAGETSGALIRLFAAGKPVAVSDYAQFAEYPDAIATKIPFGASEVDALAGFMTANAHVAAIARSQARWLAENASLEDAAEGYERALRGENDVPVTEQFALPTLPVLAELRLDRVSAERERDAWIVRCDLTNIGQSQLAAGVFGAPGYRLLAKVFRGDDEVFDRWIELPRDLLPGASASIDFEFSSTIEPLRLELSHAIQGVPHFDFAPFAIAELRA